MISATRSATWEPSGSPTHSEELAWPRASLLKSCEFFFEYFILSLSSTIWGIFNSFPFSAALKQNSLTLLFANASVSNWSKTPRKSLPSFQRTVVLTSLSEYFINYIIENFEKRWFFESIFFLLSTFIIYWINFSEKTTKFWSQVLAALVTPLVIFQESDSRSSKLPTRLWLLCSRVRRSAHVLKGNLFSMLLWLIVKIKSIS